jgi:Flp pilus assembly pilin Flp
MQTISQKLYARLLTSLSREDGQTMAEYGVVLAVITVAVITVLVALSTSIQNKIGSVTHVLNGS